MAASPLIFDFITDEQFREGLEGDAREMDACVELGAWKAVHVLAGSIVEAVLVEYLLSSGRTKPDPLKMDLSGLIAACQNDGVLSQKTAELSTALKSFRNLIHPGRAIRLQERIDVDGATVARSLVSIIVREVALKRVEEHGLTAEQIVRKIETDSTALAIADHLLRDARPIEVERLLVRVLPARYVEEAQLPEEYGDPKVLDRLASLYRAAFLGAPDEVKHLAMRRYAAVLREESGALVTTYETRFFRAGDLAFATQADQRMIKDHLLGQLKTEPTPALIAASEGIGTFLAATAKDVNRFVDPLVRLAVDPRSLANRLAADRRLKAEATRTSVEVDGLLRTRVDAWISSYEERGDRPDAINVLQSVRGAYEFDAIDDIPF